MKFRVKSLFMSLSLIAVIALVLAGCGKDSASSGSNASGGSGNQASSSAGNLLEQVKKNGKIKVGLMGTYAPV